MSKRIEKKSQPTYAEMEYRINVITSAIVDGFGRNDILHQTEVKEWGVSSRTIDNYIKTARKAIVSEAKKERHAVIETSMRRFERIYQKALASKNLKEANNALMNQLKMLGLINNTINIQQNNLTVNNEKLGNTISKDENLIEVTAELAERLAICSDESNTSNALSD